MGGGELAHYLEDPEKLLRPRWLVRAHGSTSNGHDRIREKVIGSHLCLGANLPWEDGVFSGGKGVRKPAFRS